MGEGTQHLEERLVGTRRGWAGGTGYAHSLGSWKLFLQRRGWGAALNGSSYEWEVRRWRPALQKVSLHTGARADPVRNGVFVALSALVPGWVKRGWPSAVKNNLCPPASPGRNREPHEAWHPGRRSGEGPHATFLTPVTSNLPLGQRPTPNTVGGGERRVTQARLLPAPHSQITPNCSHFPKHPCLLPVWPLFILLPVPGSMPPHPPPAWPGVLAMPLNTWLGTSSLVIQWLGLCAPNAGGLGSAPGQETKIPKVD